jgi:hypothetical protein
VTSSSTPALAALMGDEERNAFAEQGLFIPPGVIFNEQFVVKTAERDSDFASMLLHRSGSNRTSRPRRSYVVQYTDVPVPRADGTPLNLARPVVSGGLRR